MKNIPGFIEVHNFDGPVPDDNPDTLLINISQITVIKPYSDGGETNNAIIETVEDWYYTFETFNEIKELLVGSYKEKFIKFRKRVFSFEKGFGLVDIAINISSIARVRRTNVKHTFENRNIETGNIALIEEPCTDIVTHDGREITVLGSYEKILAKINGENTNE